MSAENLSPGLPTVRPIRLLAAILIISPARVPAQPDSAFSVPIEVVNAGTTMRAILHVAAGVGPHATLVSTKGFPGGNSEAFSRFMQSRGFNAISINFRGQQGSDGTYDVAGTAFDAIAFVDFLRSDDARRRFRIDPRRVAISGTSAGSYAALRAAAASESVRCAALIVPFNWSVRLENLRDNPLARTALAAQARQIASGNPPPVRLDTSFVTRTFAALETVDLRTVASHLSGREVYMIGARNDETAPVDRHFTPLRDALRLAQASVRDTILEDTHSLPATGTAVYGLVADWMSSCTR